MVRVFTSLHTTCGLLFMHHFSYSVYKHMMRDISTSSHLTCTDSEGVSEIGLWVTRVMEWQGRGLHSKSHTCKTYYADARLQFMSVCNSVARLSVKKIQFSFLGGVAMARVTCLSHAFARGRKQGCLARETDVIVLRSQEPSNACPLMRFC